MSYVNPAWLYAMATARKAARDEGGRWRVYGYVSTHGGRHWAYTVERAR